MGNPITSAIGTGIGLATGSTLGGFLSGQGLDAITSGGSSGTAQPNVQYGTGENTYTIGGKPIDTSKYFITGDKGVYNLLPMLNNPYQDLNKRDVNSSGYDTYNAINQKLADDAKAQQAFQQAFQVQQLNPVEKINRRGNVEYKYDRSVLPNYLREVKYNPIHTKGMKANEIAQPLNYVDFGFGRGNQIFDIANYAAKQNNPFFLAYAPTAPAEAPANARNIANNSTGAKNV